MRHGFCKAGLKRHYSQWNRSEWLVALMALVLLAFGLSVFLSPCFYYGSYLWFDPAHEDIDWHQAHFSYAFLASLSAGILGGMLAQGCHPFRRAFFSALGISLLSGVIAFLWMFNSSRRFLGEFLPELGPVPLLHPAAGLTAGFLCLIFGGFLTLLHRYGHKRDS